jgi:hypothetical protein
MRAERCAGGGDGPVVRVQVPLRGDQRTVSGDLPQDVYGHPGVGHPGQSGMPKVVPAQMLVAEPGHDLVPVRRVTKDRGGDPAAARSGEDAGCRVVPGRVEAPLDERADLVDAR